MTKTKDSEQTRGCSLPKTNRSSHVVDMICQIMDEDGPQPMRNMKPTQRVRNAAEQFSSEHHGEYEARGRQSSNKIDRVQRHNAAYPKMEDELSKRHSCAKVTAVNAKRSKTAQLMNTYQCSTCARKLSKLRNLNIKSLCQPYEQSKKPRTHRNRISKATRRSNRARSPNRCYRLSKIRTNKCCQMSTYQLYKHEKSGNDNLNLELSAGTAADTKTNDSETFGIDKTDKPLRLKSSSQLSKEGNKSIESDKVSVYPDTSEPSISTYHSYTSIDQEPMVSQ